MNLCPCGSKLDYTGCCEPYIKGAQVAPTAEALMRSRYTAYVKQELDYIKATHKPDESDEMSMDATRKWAGESTWLGLEILDTREGKAGDTKGTVEFKALYEQSGMRYTHHETGSFEKIEGKWYFCEGKIRQTTDVRATPKVGRNDRCPCGSGKKFKKCCG